MLQIFKLLLLMIIRCVIMMEVILIQFKIVILELRVIYS